LKVINQGIFNLKVYGKFAVLDFNPQDNKYSKELVDSSYARERDYLKRLQQYSWAPRVKYSIDGCRQIYIEYNDVSCEDTLPTTWKEQLETIVQDLHNEGIYKPSLYPKYFFSTDDGVMKALAFYSASDYAEQPIDMKFYEAILNPDRKAVVEELAVDGKLDMGLLVKRAYTDYIKWQDDALPNIYTKVYSPNS
jgi:hypothetical protein